MKKFCLIIAILAVVPVLYPDRAQAQEKAFAEASATIIIPLTATEAFPLNFGRFFPGNEGGTLMISPDGFISATATVAADASPRNPGSFYVTGETDATFSITLPREPATLTNADHSKTMIVSDWVTIPENGDPGAKLAGGAQTVKVGATLKVGPLDENPKGLYSGSYQITFAYN